MQVQSQSKLLFVDLFAGAGGVTTGIERATLFDRKIAKVIACVNHDENAIASHEANHPDCRHFTEDIRALDLTELIDICRHARKMNPTAKLYLWASLECTEYSKAKGGLAKDADSRTLADDLFRYTDAIDFDGVFIENVEEFMKGGPLRIKPKSFYKTHTELTIIKDKKTKAIKYGWEIIPERKTEYYERWVSKMKSSYSYEYDYRILNAADYGAYTSRRRYFGIFMKDQSLIRFPSPTHTKKGLPGTKQWKPVKEVLDFSDEGESIFTRKKPLSQRTMERIFAGLVKYVAKGDTSFILKYNSTNKKTGVHIPPSIHEPCPTVTTQGRIGIVNTEFIAYYYGQITLSSVNDPCNTLRTKDTGQVIRPEFIKQYNWIDRQFGQGGGKNSSVDEPIGALPSVPKANLVTANVHQCLMFPQWGINCSHSIDKPSPVLPARMDKMVPYIIQADETGSPFGVIIFKDDSEVVKKIKYLMAEYGIVDIKMRMLRINELKKITGFEEDYILKGNQQEQKKYIGNAVPVLLAKAIIEEIARHLDSPLKKAA